MLGGTNDVLAPKSFFSLPKMRRQSERERERGERESLANSSVTSSVALIQSMQEAFNSEQLNRR